MTATAPDGADTLVVFVHATTTGSAGNYFEVDAACVVEGDYDGPYFDGSLADGYHYQFDWAGTAHASTSTMTRINTATDRQWVNECRNPSFETDTDEWVASLMTLAQQSGGDVGDYMMRATHTATSGSSGVGFSDAGAAYWPVVVPGRTYTLRAVVMASTGSADYKLSVQWLDAGRNSLSTSAGSTILAGPVTTPTELAETFTAPDYAVWAKPSIGTGDSRSISDTVDIDAVYWIEGDFSDGSYFDGDTTGCFWTGTEHESASVAVQLEKPLKDLTQPQAVISVTDGASSGYIVCDGSKSTGNANIVYYEWLFDDGTNMVGQVVTKLFSIGTHTIELRIIDANGQIGYTKTTKVVS